ncbi:MAG: type II toxin-antitoxin system HicB family antitoxin [Chitinophagales bacterium]|jgi:hypothetical protein|nr:2-oxoisovalerate dehydrogenase [Sphingobacteriales bacterium]
MEEVVFIVGESMEGGYEAKCLGYSIFTDGETIQELKANVKEAMDCHFEDEVKRIVRLHFVRDEVFAI